MDSSIKQMVEDVLLRRDFVELIRLCQTDRRFWGALRLYLYETDEDLRWPAIEAVAQLMQKWWHEGNREKVREYIRGLLWQLNEESGGIGWSAPEVIAETVASIPELLEPYGSIMLASASKEEALLDGSLWAIGRLGKQISKAITFSKDKVFAAFDSDSPETLGLFAWAMGEAGVTSAAEPLARLKDRGEPVRIYIDGHFQEKSLGEWANEAIVKIEQ